MKNTILLNLAARLWRQFSSPSSCAVCIRSSFLARRNCCFRTRPTAACSWTNPARFAARRCSRKISPARSYFHPRPSAAGANGFDATSSGGSNLGPTSSNLVANITANIATYRSDNNLATNTPVPADAVTASASGLDPHISGPTRKFRLRASPRRAAFPKDYVRELVKQNTSGRDLGFFGEPRVNVMTLNFALDDLAGK